MKYLYVLPFIKLKGKIRNIYRKPVSAIITTLALLLMIGGAVAIFTNASIESMIANMASLELIILGYIGFMLFMMGVFVFQKRTALLEKQDATYVLCGPYSKKDVMTYIVFQSVLSSIMIQLFFLVYFCFIVGVMGVTIDFLLMFLVVGIVVMLFIVLMANYLYLLEIRNEKVKTIKKVVYAIMIVIIIGLILFINTNGSSNIQNNFMLFVSDPLLHYIPVLGWAKGSIMAYLQSDYILAVIYFILNLGLCFFIGNQLVNFKDLNYDRIMEDAEYVSNLKESMKSGSNDAVILANKKIKAVKDVKFGSGAKALYDKGFLILRKTNSFIRIHEVFSMLLYLAIAYIGNFGLLFYQYYILIIVMSLVSSDGLMKELKSPYIYLIPEKPGKKLFYSMLPLILRTLILVTIALIPAVFLFGATIIEGITTILSTYSYVVLFTAAVIWSIKVLKSATNAVATALLRMLIILVSIIPSLLLSFIPFFIMDHSIIFNGAALSNSYLIYISFATILSNVLIGVLFIYMSKSLLSGNNMMSD